MALRAEANNPYRTGIDGRAREWRVRRGRRCLGQGRRLFDNLPAEHIELDLVRMLTTPDVEELAQHVTHLRYRVRRFEA